MKKCPFCKNEIETSAEQCPICHRILIEKMPIARSAFGNSSNQTNSNNKKAEEKTSYTYYKSKNESYGPTNNFQLPKGSGWIISIVGSILLTVILSNIHNPSTPLPAPVPTSDTVASQRNINIPTIPDVSTKPTIPVSPVTYNFLPNGTVLYKSSSLNGSGILTITNGTDSDATIKLITSGGWKVYWVYIRANNSYSIKNINDGIYRVLFVSGSNWDTANNKFLTNPRGEAFDDNFNFETSTDQYTRYTLTLNPVVGGTATTSSIDPSEFDKY
jgi:hypothetical protein